MSSSLRDELVEAGVGILRRHFGGQTEGANRFVDFEEVVRDFIAIPAIAEALEAKRRWDSGEVTQVSDELAEMITFGHSISTHSDGHQ